jgi:uncharacterized metal-binding protein
MGNNKPLVFCCSGCSHLATMAHDIALTMDSDGIAEMSCVSWLNAATDGQVKAKTQGRKIILLEGCRETCNRELFQKLNLTVDVYINFADFGFMPRSASDGSLQENSIALAQIYQALAEAGIAAE